MSALGRMFAFLAAAASGLVAVGFAGMVLQVLEQPDLWDGGRGPDAVMFWFALLGGPALLTGVAGLLFLIGFFAGAKRGGSGLLLVPGAIVLIAGAAVGAVLYVFQPGGEEFIPYIAGPVAAAGLLGIVGGVLLRRAGRAGREVVQGE